MSALHRLTAAVSVALLATACSGAPLPRDAVGTNPDGSSAAAAAGAGAVAPGAVAPVAAGAAAGGAAPAAGAATAAGPGGPGAVGAGAAAAGAGGSGTRGGATRGGAGSTGGGTAPGAAAGRGAAGAGARSAGTPAGGRTNDAAGDLQLFSGASNTTGITATQITLCAHAALTYGAAFNTKDTDFNVFWQNLNEHGGIYGRKVVASYENDNYDPATAVSAAKTCQAKGIFALLGGIGFDQIPAVRDWAEQNHELYLYHSATVNGAAGKRYSFTSLPSVEQYGKVFAEVAAQKFPGKKVGILYRNSEFWSPGVKAFEARAAQLGVRIALEVPVEKNAGSYVQQLVSLRNAGADVVWGWENALAGTEMVKQASGQGWHPGWLLFPFNLTTQGVMADSVAAPMYGVAGWPAYSNGQYDGPFARYGADVKEFEREYAQYDPNADLKGVGGDLLFLNWVAQKGLAELFRLCGKDCTRNHFATLLSRYRGSVSPNCPVDFPAHGGHYGGDAVSVLVAYHSANGNYDWKPDQDCVTDVPRAS